MADKTTTVASYAASGGALIAGLSANEFAAVVGAGCAILTFGANLWFKFQHLKLARARVAASAATEAAEYD